MGVFIPNPAAGALAKLEAADDIHDRAEGALHVAEGLAPVLTGELAGSGRLEELPDGGWRIVFDTDYAIHVETGTSDTPAQPFLRPAAESL